jgi:flagellar biosynthesis GTPase FlhF
MSRAHAPVETSHGAAGTQVRTYRGRTVEELIPQIQQELGADALILARREGLTGGLAGFFQRPFVELEAMQGGPRVDLYDEEDVAPIESLPAPQPLLPPEHQPAHIPFYEREPPLLRPDGAYVTERLAELARAGPLEPAPVRPAEPHAEAVSRSPRFNELSSAKHSDPFALALEQASSEDLGEVVAPRRSLSPPPPTRARARASIQSGLLALGVSERFAGELIEAAVVHVLPLTPRASLSQAVQVALTQRIPVAPPLPTQGAAIVVVGPGGSGKTSCCAALLGAYRKGSTLPASCATLLRGSGKGELEMLLSPYVMKPTPIETQRAIRALRKTQSEGLLVIDTPSLSVGDRSGIRKLAGLLGELKPERVVIALPATLGAVASAQLVAALRPLGANALAMTHADETDQLGVALEAACTFGLAPEYTLDRGRSGGWRLSRIDPTGLAAKLLR